MEPWLSLVSRVAKFSECPSWTNFIWILRLLATWTKWRCQFLQHRSWFFVHFLEWDECVRFEHVDSRFHAIQRHNFDGAFRSSNWSTYYSTSIRVEVYEVLLPCTSLIIVVGWFISCQFSLDLWCKIFMFIFCCWFLLDVWCGILMFVSCDMYYHGWPFMFWDRFVALMVGYSLSPCVRLSCY